MTAAFLASLVEAVEALTIAPRCGGPARARRSSCLSIVVVVGLAGISGKSDAERSVGSGRNSLVRLSGGTSFECGKSGRLIELDFFRPEASRCC
jgi:hypothetical protein